MKEKIIELRKLGYSYKKIENKLKCSRSTISYHCKNYDLNLPNKNPNKLSDELIEKIKNECKFKSKIQVAKELKLSIKVIYKYSKGIKNIFIQKKTKTSLVVKEIKCLNCGINTKYRKNKKFCSSKCSSEYIHKQAYKNFIENNENYCNGNYSAKNFKDIISTEQNNRCAICGNESIWMDKKLVFVLDHIDGDASNNKRNNLRLICPNCDSQTSTFKSKTKYSKRRNYFRENIIKKYNGEKHPMVDKGT